MWVLEDEWERDHHPYKFGFGKLFHSGYHFVDLAAFLLKDTLEQQGVNSVEVAAKAVLAATAALPNTARKKSELERGGYGEYDVHAILDFGQCVAQLALLQNSYSDRDPNRVVTDPYKGVGRVRHERVDLKISTAMNIQVRSYQSSSTSEPKGTGVGMADHFEILIFRNPTLFPGQRFEKLTLNEITSSTCEMHNENARISLFKKFLRREETGSRLVDHELTGRLISAIYAAVAARPGRIGTSFASLDGLGDFQ